MTNTPSTPKSLRCAVYARVSSDRQDVENSLDRQVHACRKWAAQYGHRIVDPVYTDEAISGSTTLGRPALQRLLAILSARAPLPFDAVLVDDDSRLDRGGKLASLVEAFQSRGVALVAVDSGRDMTAEGEQLLNHVKAGLNEHYIHEIARRTRNGIASKVRHGYHGGGTIYGYRLIPEWPEGLAPQSRSRDNRIGTNIAIDEAQAEVVRKIFRLYGASDALGFKAIAQKLNADGIKSPRGGFWDLNAVRTVLLNRRYRGDWTWGVHRWRKKPEGLLTEAERQRVLATGHAPRQRTRRPESEHVECRREDRRIISDDLWERVQTRFAGTRSR
jgi:DNA invertase Pin-like site-specific DNA recombinase